MVDESQTALITGGTSGIGGATADKLAQLGIHVIVVGRNTERGEKTVAAIRTAGGKADFISSDLRDAASAREVARKAIELGNGHVDILINNAGIYPFGPTHEMTEEMFERVYSLNVKAPYFLVAHLAPLMAQRGSGVRVNAVSPGPTRTEGTGAMSEGLEQLAAQAPAGRPATATKSRRRLSF
jgi:NAD(P)-dependent dehydrogenase (short-subunit alcohol dehydrogenase family)